MVRNEFVITCFLFLNILPALFLEKMSMINYKLEQVCRNWVLGEIIKVVLEILRLLGVPRH